MSDERPPTCHNLKCWPESFTRIVEGDKTFELRRNDRDYQVGDFLLLQEWEPPDVAHPDFPVGYTGNYALVKVTDIIREGEAGEPFGDMLAANVCAMAIRLVEASEP